MDNALYSMRGRRVSAAQGMITCTIAENIHQEKDQSLARSKSGVLPAPFRTVLRGIAEEVSPELARHISSDTLLLLGLAFNLRNFHPDILFAVVVPYRLNEVIEIARNYPGVDWFEGKILAVTLTGERTELHGALAEDNWLPGGKASLMRTIEFLDAVRREHKIPFSAVIEKLARGNTDWIRS